MFDPELDTSKYIHLQVLLPTEVLIDEAVLKVIAHGENGSFCLLPRHIDFVSALVPSVLYFNDQDNVEKYAAIDQGILVKSGHKVQISTFNGVCGTALEQLHKLIDERFLELDEHERKTRTALARLEAGALRGFRELQERARGG